MAVSLYPFSVKTVSAASSRRCLRVRLRSWTLMKPLPREKPTDQSVGKYSAGQWGLFGYVYRATVRFGKSCRWAEGCGSETT